VPKTPIEMMFDGVEWFTIPNDSPSENDGIPVATHWGVLKFGDLSLRCYQLNTGQRVFDCEDMAQFFEGIGFTPEG
jgi:hypothetical protein